MSSIIRAVEAVKAVRAQRLRGKTTVNHMQTKTTLKTNELADVVKNQLGKIVSQIDKMIQKNPDITISEIQDVFKIHVGTIIAEAVRESYLRGFNFIEEFAGRTIRLQPHNLFQIDTQIEQNIQSFWNNIQKLLLESRQKRFESKFRFAGAAGEEKTFLQKITGFLNAAAISMTFTALSQGTISGRVQQFNEDSLIANIRIGIIPPAGLTQPLLLWVSERDSKVCPICQNLDGRSFVATDPNIPIPGPEERGGSTHWSCRCRLLPEINGKAFNA